MHASCLQAELSCFTPQFSTSLCSAVAWLASWATVLSSRCTASYALLGCHPVARRSSLAGAYHGLQETGSSGALRYGYYQVLQCCSLRACVTLRSWHWPIHWPRRPASLERSTLGSPGAVLRCTPHVPYCTAYLLLILAAPLALITVQKTGLFGRPALGSTMVPRCAAQCLLY